MAAQIKLNIDEDGDPVLEFTVDENTGDVEKRLLNRFFAEGRKHGVEITSRSFSDASEKVLTLAQVRIGPRLV